MAPGMSLWKTAVAREKTKLSAFVILLLHLPVCKSQCSRGPPGPAKCGSMSLQPNRTDDTAVFPATKANCNFTVSGDLCSYRQGCRDPDMTNWTAANGFASANQSTSKCGINDTYSIMESPWLNFTTESCVQFSFLRRSPFDLDVFFDVKGHQTQTVENRTKGSHRHDQIYNGNFTVHSLIGKILFRAFGGGSSSSPSAMLELYKVSVQRGACTGQGGLVISTVSPPALSSPTSTSRRGGFVITETSSSDKATIFSPPPTPETGTPPTGGRRLNSDAADDSPGAAAIAGAVVTVVVVIAVVVVVVVIWRRRWRKSATAGGKETGTGSDSSGVKTGGAGVGKGSGQNGNSYTEIPNSHFALAPPSPEGDYAAIDDVTSHTEVGTRHAGTGPYDLPKVTSRDADTKPFDLPKVTSRDADTKPYDLPKVTSRDADTKPNDLAKVTSRDADAKPYDLPKVTSRDAGTKPLDLAKAIPLDEDIDPYEVSEDGAPRKGHSSHGQGLVLTNPHGCPQEKLFPCEDGEGDYSEIGGPQSAPGSHENVSYSQVQKTDKKPDESSPEDEYSVVSKKDNRPEVAVKPGYPKGDYNRINLTGSQAVVLDKTGEATSDPYDRIGGVPSLDDAGDGGERTEAGGSQGQDEYNRLGHHEAGKAPTRSRERGATGKAYDHVQSEAYSKARIGKRNVVISSDYDHVQT